MMAETGGEGRPASQQGRAGFWTVAGLVAALSGPLVLASPPMQTIYAIAGTDIGVAFVGQAFLWIVLAFALACLVFGERLPIAAIGLVRPTWRSVVTGLAIGVGIYVALFVFLVALVHFDLFDAKNASNVVLGWPLWLRLFALVTAGVVEEAVYRGYAIERLAALIGRRWLAALIAVVAFALAHIPFWGLAAVATPLLGGGFFALVYLWRRDLIACMVAHTMVDFVGMVVAPALNPAS